MRIIVNGAPHTVYSSRLHEILLELNYDKPAIATAVNGTFVSKNLRQETELNEGDQLEIVSPIEGG